MKKAEHPAGGTNKKGPKQRPELEEVLPVPSSGPKKEKIQASRRQKESQEKNEGVRFPWNQRGAKKTPGSKTLKENQRMKLPFVGIRREWSPIPSLEGY